MNEIQKIKDRYKRRESRRKDRYNVLSPYMYMTLQEKERTVIRWMRYAGIENPSAVKLLEIGCGSGDNLLMFLKLGFLPENLSGNEMLPERAAAARRRLPKLINMFEGDASELNLGDEKFDVVFQSMVFSSILNSAFRVKLADKIWSLVKPGGGILWYDFVYNNPWNKDVCAVKFNEVKNLFPKADVKKWKLTLAPLSAEA